jgi:hypothetical protein
VAFASISTATSIATSISTSTATATATATSTALQHKRGSYASFPLTSLLLLPLPSPDSILSIAGIVSIGLKYNP